MCGRGFELVRDRDANLGVRAIVCGPKVYRFEDVLFEVHSYFGPWPLRKDGSLKARAGRKFWMLWERFRTLSKAEQERYRVQ